MSSLVASAGMEAWLSAPAEVSGTRGSELRSRVVSAMVLGATALLATYFGGLVFAAFVAAMSAVALWEWMSITDVARPFWLRAAAVACLAAGLVALVLPSPALAFGLLILPATVALVAATLSRPALWTALGMVYVGCPAAAFLVLRGSEPNGFLAIVLILAVVAASDTGAYFGGRRFGGPKLWSRVSPKKTWSGALSGLASAALTGAAAARLSGSAGLGLGLLLGAALSIAGQAGDLLESAVKRRFGVKDSGRILPGHGGVLDRVDGLFVAAALAWLIAALGFGGDLLTLSHDLGPQLLPLG